MAKADQPLGEPPVKRKRNVVAMYGLAERSDRPRRHLDDGRCAKIDALQSAAGVVADIVKAACPSEVAARRPGDSSRSASDATLQAVETSAMIRRPASTPWGGSSSPEHDARRSSL